MDILEYLTSIRGIREDTLREVDALILPNVGKVIFPIFDLYGNKVGTNSRSIKKNWKLSSAFDKRHLYLFYKTWPYIIKRGYVVIVEGIFDALALWQEGIKNVCAMFGGVLMHAQQLLLLRFTDKQICLLDGDGKARGARFNQAVHSWNMLTPEGLDPDEFVFKYGTEFLVEQFRRCINERSGGNRLGGLGDRLTRL
ncbi:toprim domain-containing protein [Candidatus Babeliales bacterium]|nr:toprim domain-containing protein [Candidatus Babeliales bacterium]